MQPPPRKGGYLKVLKNLHSEQVSKLQAKNQQECELLEDIRSFTKQRSAIERIYGESLLKLASSYQNRKIACVPDIRLEDGSEAWNVFSVWRTVLDETEKMGKCRLAGVEVFQQHISEDAKQTRQNKLSMGKKLVDQLVVCQKELHLQVQDLDRVKKVYTDEETVAMDAREKASAAEEKLKRKKGSIFQSITSLQKNSAKFATKRDMCDERSHGARNDYVLNLVSANAHQRRYYEIDFERILRTMECDMYDKVAEYLTLLGRTELLTCSAAQVSYTKIRDQSQTITRGYNLRCYLTFYPMLGQNIQYDFDPNDEDKQGIITIIDDSHREQLEIEAKKLIGRVTKEAKVIRDCCRRIQKLQAGAKTDEGGPGASSGDPDTRVEELRQIIRKSETEKMKSEAKLEALREGGVEFEDYAKSVDSDSLAVDLDNTLSRSGSSVSVREEAEPPPPVDYEETPATNQLERQATDTSVQQVEERQETFANWDPVDPVNVDWGDDDDDVPAAPQVDTSYDTYDGARTADAPPGVKCIALYAYTSQNPDELTFQEDEELELVGEGDGDGWVSARNYKGEVGLIPQNYIEVTGGSTAEAVPQTEIQAAPVETVVPVEPQASSFTAVDYSIQPRSDVQGSVESPKFSPEDVKAYLSFTSIGFGLMEATNEVKFETNFDTFDDDVPSEPPPDLPPPDLPPPPPPPTSIALNGVDVIPKAPLPKLDLPVTGDDFSEYCIALYDYEATCHEELTFEEGEIIKILATEVHDVDDGWWMGEIRGQQGLFPSLVVEECHQNGEPLSPEDLSGASPTTTPPPHTPPEVPGFLLPPEGIIITMPTPEVETVEEALKLKEKKKEEENQNNGEAVDSRQVTSSPESDGKPSNDGHDKDYSELVSSPDATAAEEPSESRKDSDTSDDTTIAEIAIDETSTVPQNSTNGAKKPPRPSVQKNTDSNGKSAPTVQTSKDGDQDSSGGNLSDGEDGVLLDDEDHPPPPPPAPSGGGVGERYREEAKMRGGSIELTTEDPNGTAPGTTKSPTPSDGPPDLDIDKLQSLDRLKESDA